MSPAPCQSVLPMYIYIYIKKWSIRVAETMKLQWISMIVVKFISFCSGYFVIIGVDSVLLFRSHRRGLSLFTGMEVTIFFIRTCDPPYWIRKKIMTPSPYLIKKPWPPYSRHLLCCSSWSGLEIQCWHTHIIYYYISFTADVGQNLLWAYPGITFQIFCWLFLFHSVSNTLIY